jgi:hypothetical protein
LLVPLSEADAVSALEFWRWLVPEPARPLFATALGDLFLVDASGQVLWLDVGCGTLEVVAVTEAEFARAAADTDNAANWFGAALVDQLRAAGKVLGPGECYSYLQLPILGGEYEPANFMVCDVVSHFRTCGPIHERLSQLPDGATVEFSATE